MWFHRLMVAVGPVLTVGDGLFVADEFALVNLDRHELENRREDGEKHDRGSCVGCIAGALSRAEDLDLLARAGFVEATVRFTAPVADGMHNAIVRAAEPGPTCPDLQTATALTASGPQSSYGCR